MATGLVLHGWHWSLEGFKCFWVHNMRSQGIPIFHSSGKGHFPLTSPFCRWLSGKYLVMLCLYRYSISSVFTLLLLWIHFVKKRLVRLEPAALRSRVQHSTTGTEHHQQLMQIWRIRNKKKRGPWWRLPIMRDRDRIDMLVKCKWQDRRFPHPPVIRLIKKNNS